VDCFDRVTGVPFVVFPDVHQHRGRIAAESGARFFHSEFADAGAGFVDDS
jgi:hypothetical protein